MSSPQIASILSLSRVLLMLSRHNCFRHGTPGRTPRGEYKLLLFLCYIIGLWDGGGKPFRCCYGYLWIFPASSPPGYWEALDQRAVCPVGFWRSSRLRAPSGQTPSRRWTDGPPCAAGSHREGCCSHWRLKGAAECRAVMVRHVRSIHKEIDLILEEA